ncbi:hypothetical protein PAXRUDRAFT_833197 [Paxillus rubicundulus Ve08.2h10]|uniref:Uncharacterized protein n=1 Tax=Paxillus rubicundulus Ve08.2h10 TaxID=930991 RepID=A0A0D0DAL7_9AGAM|nr:hypothetical protein PAXRUDRAFT_833197 [Paxillus rubicundulus Ve08.2h10]
MTANRYYDQVVRLGLQPPHLHVPGSGPSQTFNSANIRGPDLINHHTGDRSRGLQHDSLTSATKFRTLLAHCDSR